MEDGHNRMIIAKLLYECGMIENGIELVQNIRYEVNSNALYRYMTIKNEIDHPLVNYVAVSNGTTPGHPAYTLNCKKNNYEFSTSNAQA